MIAKITSYKTEYGNGINPSNIVCELKSRGCGVK